MGSLSKATGSDAKYGEPSKASSSISKATGGSGGTPVASGGVSAATGSDAAYGTPTQSPTMTINGQTVANPNYVTSNPSYDVATRTQSNVLPAPKPLYRDEYGENVYSNREMDVYSRTQVAKTERGTFIGRAARYVEGGQTLSLPPNTSTPQGDVYTPAPYEVPGQSSMYQNVPAQFRSPGIFGGERIDVSKYRSYEKRQQGDIIEQAKYGITQSYLLIGKPIVDKGMAAIGGGYRYAESGVRAVSDRSIGSLYKGYALVSVTAAARNKDNAFIRESNLLSAGYFTRQYEISTQQPLKFAAGKFIEGYGFSAIMKGVSMTSKAGATFADIGGKALAGAYIIKTGAEVGATKGSFEKGARVGEEYANTAFFLGGFSAGMRTLPGETKQNLLEPYYPKFVTARAPTRTDMGELESVTIFRGVTTAKAKYAVGIAREPGTTGMEGLRFVKRPGEIPLPRAGETIRPEYFISSRPFTTPKGRINIPLKSAEYTVPKPTTEIYFGDITKGEKGTAITNYVELNYFKRVMETKPALKGTIPVIEAGVNLQERYYGFDVGKFERRYIEKTGVKTLPSSAVERSLIFTKIQLATDYGSLVAEPFFTKGTLQKARGIEVGQPFAGDIDTQLLVGSRGAKASTVTEYSIIKRPTIASGRKIKLNLKEGFLIETKARGQPEFAHARDIHAGGDRYLGEEIPTGGLGRRFEMPYQYLKFDVGRFTFSKRVMSPQEFAHRKLSSSLTITETGLQPEAHRMKDIKDALGAYKDIVARMPARSKTTGYRDIQTIETYFKSRGMLEEPKATASRPSPISSPRAARGYGLPYGYPSLPRSASASLSTSYSLPRSSSLSPSISKSLSISTSLSYPRSASLSPSLSASASLSPSFSVSKSMSASRSMSASTSLSPSRSTSLSTSIYTPPSPPRPGAIPFFQLEPTKRRKKKGKRIKVSFTERYVPSVEALALNIRAPKINMGAIRTGLVVRPIKV